jgi:hypothetical protein
MTGPYDDSDKQYTEKMDSKRNNGSEITVD